jgi:hypothetical protein
MVPVRGGEESPRALAGRSEGETTSRPLLRRRRVTGLRGLGARLRFLEPLKLRDFALLWSAATVSLVGDGIYLVAVAWQTYEISNLPTAL